MPENHGIHETAALIVLTLENREVTNPELTNDWGIRLRPAGRDSLSAAGLLESRKERGRLVYRITDDGIAWCERELSTIEPPDRTGPLVRVAFAALHRLVGHLRRSDTSLVDVLRAPDLESSIRTAYHALAVKPQDWVLLAKLRARLDGADRDEVDQTLLAMTGTGLVHLAPSSNRKALTDADHAAAIRIGDQDKHLLAIEES